eukprot:461710-Hanusia_phi.AAC.3
MAKIFDLTDMGEYRRDIMDEGKKAQANTPEWMDELDFCVADAVGRARKEHVKPHFTSYVKKALNGRLITFL